MLERLRSILRAEFDVSEGRSIGSNPENAETMRILVGALKDMGLALAPITRDIPGYNRAIKEINNRAPLRIGDLLKDIV